MKPRIRFSWGKPLKDSNGNILPDFKDWIYLEIFITHEEETVAESLINTIEESLIEKGFDCALLKCPAYDYNEYFDCLAFDRDHGNVTEQKKEIMTELKKIKSELTKSLGEFAMFITRKKN